MPPPDERASARRRGAAIVTAPAAPESPASAVPPSKTQRKAEMHALRDLGETLIALESKRLAELAAEVGLPDRLVEAIQEARSITAWGGRKRQSQYVGKLLRDVDPAPIERRLALWSQGHAADSAHQHALEQWRERLIADPAALDALAADHPQLDRPRFRALIARAREERARNTAPRAYRELFRELKALGAMR